MEIGCHQIQKMKLPLGFRKRYRRYYIIKYLNKKFLENKKRNEKENEIESDEASNCSSDTNGPESFEELGVDDWLIKISKSVQIIKPTKIQKLCLPLIIEGKNVIGSSETGTGKTICYCWGMLQELNKNLYAIFGLILLPTRELVFQIVEQFQLYGNKIGVKILSCIGGFSLIDQRKSILSKPHIVVGTPGRVSDILDDCIDVKNCFKRLKFLVLDEADLLLQKSFEEKLKIILNNIPKEVFGEPRRTLFFSSTITDSINLLIKTFPNDKLILVNANKKQKPLKNLDQRYIYIDSIAQMTYLVYILKNKLTEMSGIIFTANSYKCELIYTVLNSLGSFSIESIHSSKDQRKRMSSLLKFKNGLCKILIATDIISRGIDIPKVAFVINFDFPNDTIQYIHRIGRTARANRKGLSISFVDKKDLKSFNNVKIIMKKKLKPYILNKNEVLTDMLKIGKVVKKAEMMLQEKKDIKKENADLKNSIYLDE
ncbi:ATP-dependent RNA helicase DBP8, putative [Plasmodium berghei]|uniref:ATP-dependent RNA helicase DBP8, putative n=2 Tax=Plasmodium berghei TaxID=5821 RepID=A0A509AQB0_PLABA|nr:ATP-dependent RNA helicase DBP8, putative [Plasmodium berghei ANKA]CXJ00862.1 ATP-dependent RNA helicase DBP8, putative [Plasmodium berghei]SCL98086.1 ATP-dependent RNA helicase DBP8, putative [Plasmodium berghei]SCM16748.1 ATP-dependent RNA helicase DBP8, putative [Plasmodium berghei]SCM18546.1 ATP-dependent RNA helicase DBP8, putative [Plasmodium berghei]SCN27979.1 ATP-dependent RNA helicase DBP8, putative [Plasmodium berghei]|eukprot:XP_034423632.1 ATP-dependent RNA helicase DBP8, putative [Plasmodium berghei ANKA]